MSVNTIRKTWLFYLNSLGRLIWTPTQATDDTIRKERILNIILLFSLGLTGLIALIMIIKTASGIPVEGFSSLVHIGSFGLFFLLLAISRAGKPLISAVIMILVYTIPTVGAMAYWGVDLPHTWIILTLLIIMSGVLISARAAFLVTGVFFTSMYALAELQINRIIKIDNWKAYPFHSADTVTAGVIFSVIAGVTWLSNREIEASLDRAKASEQALREERDHLEVRVEERTVELRAEQQERLNQLNRFAEFGKLASGILHDLSSPLTAVSLNLDLAQSEERQTVLTAQKHIDNAKEAAKRMEVFLKSARKQLQQNPEQELFSLNQEIKQIITILTFKARDLRVQLTTHSEEDILIEGDPISFHRVISNLITNAIDAYETVKPASLNPREVHVELSRTEKQIELLIQDWGSGIAKEHLGHIFDPFFTTKSAEQGMGLGLVQVKEIVEQKWGGTISVDSTINQGTTFTIRFPALS